MNRRDTEAGWSGLDLTLEERAQTDAALLKLASFGISNPEGDLSNELMEPLRLLSPIAVLNAIKRNVTENRLAYKMGPIDQKKDLLPPVTGLHLLN